ncbi:Alternative NAD(P)H-ubiquinone oxidoreductase C1, chloroplastic/mitochondrial [Linum grandiflorum]
MKAVSFPAAMAQCTGIRSSFSTSSFTRSLSVSTSERFPVRPSSNPRRLHNSNSATSRTTVHCLSTSSGMPREKLFPFSSAPTPFRTFQSGFTSSYLRRDLPVRFATSEAVGNGAAGAPDPPVEEKPPRVYTWPYKKNPRVCILGGGFGGLYTALRLESLVWPDDKKPQVLLVDQAERFVFKPMLYEILTGVDSWEIAPRFADLLSNSSVQFVQDRVKVLQPCDHLGNDGPGTVNSAGTVLLQSGLLIEYDCQAGSCSGI